jgi:hypothetical protein
LARLFLFGILYWKFGIYLEFGYLELGICTDVSVRSVIHEKFGVKSLYGFQTLRCTNAPHASFYTLSARKRKSSFNTYKIYHIFFLDSKF